MVGYRGRWWQWIVGWNNCRRAQAFMMLLVAPYASSMRSALRHLIVS